MELTQDMLEQIEAHISKILPELLTRNPEIATTIEGILAQHFPTRDEFAQLLEETRQFRSETNDRFDKMDGRFDKMDGRLDKVDTTILSMRRDIVKLQAGQQNIIDQLEGQRRWFDSLSGNLGNEAGTMSEDLVAAALRFGLKTDDIDPENILLRQTITDPDGLVRDRHYRSEVDIIARNGSMTVFEVKTRRVRPGDVSDFALKVKLLGLQNPGTPVKGLLIVPRAGQQVRDECELYGIELVS